jgi:hypothetical protein
MQDAWNMQYAQDNNLIITIRRYMKKGEKKKNSKKNKEVAVSGNHRVLLCWLRYRASQIALCCLLQVSLQSAWPLGDHVADNSSSDWMRE